ncbi:MAG: hypothetical protein ACLUI3_17645 [Christensenellales bacterium]
MTARGFYLLLFGSLMLFTALSVGSSGFSAGRGGAFCWALSLLCVCLAAFLPLEQSVEGGQAARGGVPLSSARAFRPPQSSHRLR